MKLAIISDSHDNMANLGKVVDWLKKEKIGLVIHCGDISSPSTLKQAFAGFQGELKASLGNADFGLPEEYEQLPKIKIFSDSGELFLAKKIAFIHHPDIAENMAESGKYDLVFYGHTHKPWEEKRGNCRLINPGNIAGAFYKASFAVYDLETDKLDLKILELL